MLDKFFETISDFLGTKTCFMIFCLIAIVPLLCQLPKDILGWQTYISQTLIQLVALSGVAIVSKKESRKIKELLQETHDTTLLEMIRLKEIAKEIHKNINKGDVFE